MISKPKADAAAMVRIEQLNKWFGNAHVLKNISLNVHAGEKVVTRHNNEPLLLETLV